MPYAELHAKTNFSFLEGASHAEELVRRSAELGYAALAVTDRHSLAGVVRAHGAAKDAGVKLLVGAEIHPQDALPLVLWATDRSALGVGLISADGKIVTIFADPQDSTADAYVIRQIASDVTSETAGEIAF